MSDPYRSSSLIRCARCSEPLERSPAGYDCPHGHGFWDPDRDEIDGTPIEQLGNLIPTQLHPGYCPNCRKLMQLRRWMGVTIEVCRHGVWVAADDADYFLSRAGRSRKAES